MGWILAIFSILFIMNDTPITPEPDMTAPIDKILQKIEKETGCEMIVTSGYRTKAHNKKVGGSKNSYHLTDRARDIVPKNKECISIKQLGEIACKMTSTMVYSRHVHIDSRKKKICITGKYK